MTPHAGWAPGPLCRRAFAVAALGALLVGCGGQGPDGARTAGDRSRSTSTPSPPSTASVPASAPASGKAPHALARSVPVGLRIPAIGVDTPVMGLGLAPDGSVQVPPVTAHDRAGWYRHSPTPGQVGPSVVLGHVTVGPHGDGVFRHLARLHRGNRIEVRLRNGTDAVFTVTAVRTVAKARFPTDEVYGDVSRPELRLITCGGPRTGDGYLDNVIVFAELSSPS
jgi:sortase (surface protein transpeptidase)